MYTHVKPCRISDAQLRFVNNAPSGTGLIKCGSVVIPFDNQIGKDTDLYKLYNTNLHEKIAMREKNLRGAFYDEEDVDNAPVYPDRGVYAGEPKSYVKVEVPLEEPPKNEWLIYN